MIIFDKERVSGQQDSSSKDFDSQTQEELIRVATDLTDTNDLNNLSDYTVSQIGDYQIWRDSDEIAIVDTKSDRLVAYGEINSDFFIKATPQTNLPDLDNQDKLLSKVVKLNPDLNLEYNAKVIDKAHKFIAPLDPVSRADEIKKHQESVLSRISQAEITAKLKIAFDSVKESLKDASTKLKSSFQDNILNAGANIKRKSELIATQLLSQKLMNKSLSKFESAYQKTKEECYSIGNYKIVRERDANFKLYNKDEQLILSFQQKPSKIIGRDKPVLKSHSGDLNAVTQALTSVGNINNLAVSDQTVDLDLENKEQDRRFSQASKTIKSYLDINQESRIEKTGFVVSFDLTTKTIKYQDKQDQANNFEAKLVGKGWQRVQGSINAEKAEYFQDVAQKIDTYKFQQQQKQQLQQASTKQRQR